MDSRPYPKNLIEDILETTVEVTPGMQEGLALALESLSEREYQAIMYRYVNKSTYKNIARDLSVGMGTARTILVRALRKLRHPDKKNYIEFGRDLKGYGEITEDSINTLGLTTRSYLALKRYGLGEVSSLIDFIKEGRKSLDWVPNLRAEGEREVLYALLRRN